jgi:hypothetical protein
MPLLSLKTENSAQFVRQEKDGIDEQHQQIDQKKDQG